jgi:CheY-like chemotaxis protein
VKAAADADQLNIPVIAVTAYRGHRRELLAEGFADLVEKPVDPVKLCGVVRRHTMCGVVRRHHQVTASREPAVETEASSAPGALTQLMSDLAASFSSVRRHWPSRKSPLTEPPLLLFGSGAWPSRPP